MEEIAEEENTGGGERIEDASRVKGRALLFPPRLESLHVYKVVCYDYFLNVAQCSLETRTAVSLWLGLRRHGREHQS